MDSIVVNIPLNNSDQSVSLPLSEIDNIIDLLINELPKLDLWIHIAVLYFNANRGDITEKILKIIIDDKDSPVKVAYSGDVDGKIQILNYLSAYYAVLAYRSKNDVVKQKEFYTKAIECSGLIDELERKTSAPLLSWICRGYQYLFKDERDNPQQEFTNALKAKQNCLPALLGMACLYFKSGDYPLALAQYKHVLQTTLNCPASVRVGIGMCHYRMNNMEFARRAFERALEVDNHNVEALASLAILKKSNAKKDRKTNYQEAHDLLHKAYDIDRQNPVVLSQLADYTFFYSWTTGGSVSVKSNETEIVTRIDLSEFITSGLQIRINNSPYRVKSINTTTIILETPYTGGTSTDAEITYKNYKNVKDYGLSAISNTDDDQIKGETHYFIARAYHAMGDYNNAFLQYSNAVRLKFELAKYGLAQMHYLKGESTEARTNLKSLIKHYPECTEAREFFGVVTKDLRQETEEFTKILKTDPNHIKSLIYHASYLMKNPYPKYQLEACKTFEKAIKLSEQKNKPIQFEVLFDVASLYHKLKDLTNAEHYYNIAIKQYCDEHGTVIDNKLFTHILKPELVTVAYNYALLKEELGEWEKALYLYRGILEICPQFIDAELRLINFKIKSGLLNESIENLDSICATMGSFDEIKKVRYKKEYYKKARLMKAHIYFAKNEYQEGKKIVDELLGQYKDDPYCNLEKANYYFRSASSTKNYLHAITHAADLYKSVLKKSPNNGYAVNGLAIILAEKGLLNEANQLFQILKDSIRDIPCAYFNQAIILRAQQKPLDSIEALKNYIKRFNDPTNYEPELYLAHAYFDEKKYKELIGIYTKCLMMNPTNIKLWFNLALSHTQYSAYIITVEKVHLLPYNETTEKYPCCDRGKNDEGCTTKRHRTVNDVQTAVQSMMTARDLFHWLSESFHTFSNPPYQKKTAEVYYESCAQNIEPAKQHLDYEMKQAEQKQKDIDLHNIQIQMAEQLKQQQLEQKRNEEKQRQILEEERYKKEKLEFQEIQKITAISNPETDEGEKKSRKKKKELPQDFDDIFGDDDNTGGQGKKIKRKKERKAFSSSEDDGELSSDEDDDKPLNPKKRRLVKSSEQSKVSGPVFSDDEVFSSDDDDKPLGHAGTENPETENAETENKETDISESKNQSDEDENLFDESDEEPDNAEKRKADGNTVDESETKKAKITESTEDDMI